MARSLPARKTPQGLARSVAKRAGVSVMTVSRVFSGAAGVSEDTRRRVMEVAGEVGYHPNSAARALRRGRPMTVGFVVSSASELCGSYHSETVAALESVVSAKGYTLALMVPRTGETVSDLIGRVASARAVSAVVLRMDVFPEAGLDRLAAVPVPVILGSCAPSRALQERSLRAVRYDNRAGIAQAVRHLHALGHRRIAYLGGTPGWLDSVERKEGFVDTMQGLGLEARPEWLRDCRFAEGHASGLEAANAVFSAVGARPTAIVCASDEIAAGVFTAARRWAIALPTELSVTGFDDANWCEFLTPQLTTVRHSGFELGRRIGDELLELLAGSEDRPHDILLETSLSVRHSTCPPPPDAASNGKGRR